MYVIELHDDDTANETHGTLAAHLGRSGGIKHPLQVAIDLQDERTFIVPWRRAYLKTAEDIKAVWVRDNQGLRYLALRPDYPSTWHLPFVRAPNARIAVGVWGRDVSNDVHAGHWASAALLGGAITAVLLQRGEVRAAWELIGFRVALVARGPLPAAHRRKRPIRCH